jgi:hypothetical protein
VECSGVGSWPEDSSRNIAIKRKNKRKSVKRTNEDILELDSRIHRF